MDLPLQTLGEPGYTPFWPAAAVAIPPSTFFGKKRPRSWENTNTGTGSVLGFMGKAELKAALVDIGMSQAELSRRLGLDPSTVCNWVEVPRYAVAYIELYAKVKKAFEEILNGTG